MLNSPTFDGCFTIVFVDFMYDNLLDLLILIVCNTNVMLQSLLGPDVSFSLS